MTVRSTNIFILLSFFAALLSFSTAAQDTKVLYRLGSGDQVRVIVFGEENLSGIYKVGDEGYIAMPLIGGVMAQGLTVSELEVAIEGELKPDYLKNPQVSIEVLNYRPFYILGEVNNPGSYSFISGITVIEAVALAGGFTYRARKSKVYIKRTGNEEEEIFSVNEFIMPGDVIRVRERIF